MYRSADSVLFLFFRRDINPFCGVTAWCPYSLLGTFRYICSRGSRISQMGTTAPRLKVGGVGVWGYGDAAIYYFGHFPPKTT